MKRIAKISLFALVLVILVGLVGLTPGLRPPAPLQPVAHAADDPNTLTLDVALDFRTFTNTGLSPRGAVALGYGKVFPGGTLSGISGNDPTQPVKGVAPIGDWVLRTVDGIPYPSGFPTGYSSTPVSWGTMYFVLNGNKDAITGEGYLTSLSTGVVLESITGGIGRFSGASGSFEMGPVSGPNVTGAPNARVVFHFQPGSVRGGGN
jgi:hypothetical protein